MTTRPHHRAESMGSSPSRTAGPTVFLHVGTPKSGTTHLQARMSANREQAERQGLLWPGPARRVQVEAVRDLLSLEAGGSLAPDGPWSRLATTLRAWSGPRALISMEWLGESTPAQAEAAVRSVAPAPVEIVVTARDLLRTFVAQWQEMTKNYRPWTWAQFVEEMTKTGSGPAHSAFWRQQDLPAVLRTWSAVVPAHRIHLVTVPAQESDPDLLWRRFCFAVGLDGSTFTSPGPRNESLGAVSAVLMQRINVAALASGVDHATYQRTLHKAVARRVLASYRGREQSIAVSAEVDAWIRERAESLVDDVRRLDLQVVGDLADLLPGPALLGIEPADVGDAELLETCIRALVDLSTSPQSGPAHAGRRPAGDGSHD